MQINTQIIKQRKQQEYEKYHELEFARLWQDETTWVAESLDAPLEKDLQYYLRGGELYSNEGLALGKIFDDSIDYYALEAQIHPEHTFQYRRALAEKDEYLAMLAMAHGSGPNTMVAVSTYPEELTDAQKDVLGYQFKRKLGFIRVIQRLESGRLSMWTHSFDGNDRDGIEAMYAKLGARVDWERDVLEQRVACDVDPLDQELLGDNLLYAYDKTLHQKHGGGWYAGRTETEWREAISFVESQRDLVAHHVGELLKHGQQAGFKSNQRYDFAIAMRRRYAGKQVVASDVAGEMNSAGADGRANGETASGCGVTIAAQTSQNLLEAGYKVKTREAFKLGECVACLKERYVGECSVCQSCEEANNRGTDLLAVRKRALREREKQQREQEQRKKVVRADTKPQPESKKEIIDQKYGKHMQTKEFNAIGGTVLKLIDERTNQIVGNA